MPARFNVKTVQIEPLPRQRLADPRDQRLDDLPQFGMVQLNPRLQVIILQCQAQRD